MDELLEEMDSLDYIIIGRGAIGSPEGCEAFRRGSASSAAHWLGQSFRLSLGIDVCLSRAQH